MAGFTDFMKGLGGVLKTVGVTAADALIDSPREQLAMRYGLSHENQLDDFLDNKRKQEAAQLRRIELDNQEREQSIASENRKSIIEGGGLSPGQTQSSALSQSTYGDVDPSSSAGGVIANIKRSQQYRPLTGEDATDLGKFGGQLPGPGEPVDINRPLSLKGINADEYAAINAATKYDQEQERYDVQAANAARGYDIAEGNLGLNRERLTMEQNRPAKVEKPESTMPVANQFLSLYKTNLGKTGNPYNAAVETRKNILAIAPLLGISEDQLPTEEDLMNAFSNVNFKTDAEDSSEALQRLLESIGGEVK
jgi:hypothetical protein